MIRQKIVFRRGMSRLERYQLCSHIGHNEDVEADSDLIYESLIAQKIQSEISSSMSKLDVEPSGASSSVPSIKGGSNKDFQLA
jgi:hypothetical protein